MTAVNCCLI